MGCQGSRFGSSKVFVHVDACSVGEAKGWAAQARSRKQRLIFVAMAQAGTLIWIDYTMTCWGWMKQRNVV
jgi:hypothetical protein